MFMRNQRFLGLNHRVAAAVVLSLFVLLAYRHYVHETRRINYRIFNVEETVSWAENETGIYRTQAQGLLDNRLLSVDAWRQFVLSFNLVYPREGGIIYQYHDPDHYRFVYFHQPSHSIIWTEKNDTEIQALHRDPLPAKPLLSCRLEVKEDESRLLIDGKPASVLSLKNASGQFGIMINDADNPRMIFRNVNVNGVLADGQTIRGQSPPVFNPSPWRYAGAMLPFYLILLFIGLLAGWGMSRGLSKTPLDPSCDRQKDIPLNIWSAGAVHLLLAAVLFAPFFLKGEIFVSSYDNLGEIYPLFFLSKHKFTQMIHSGAWSLWNPFFHNGTPFYSNHWNMIYYPLNWIVFLFKDALVMPALTFKTFLEVFLTGWLAWGFFSREIPSRFWALVSSIAYQLGSFLIFSLSIFPTVSLFFSMTLYLYVLWSMPERRAALNAAMIAGAVYLVMTSANVVFIFYAVLALVVISLYRLTGLDRERGRAFGVALAGTLAGVLMSAVRIIPTFAAIMRSNRIVDNYYTLHDRFFMIIRLFMPEVTGWFGPDSFNALTSPNLQLIFRQMDMPSNPQNAFFVYYGILPALLLVLSLFTAARGRHQFWKIYTLIALAIGLLVQPVWGILSVIFFPLFHFSYHTIIIPVGICALIGHAGAFIENNELDLKGIFKKSIFVLFLVEAYILVFLTYLFPGLTAVTRWVFILTFAGYGGAVIVRRIRPKWARVYRAGASVFFAILSGSLFFAASTLVLMRPFPRKEGLAASWIVPFLAFVLVALIMLCAGAGKDRRPRSRWHWAAGGILIAAVPFLFGGLFDSGIFAKIFVLPEGLRIYATDLLLAHARLFLIVPLGFLAIAFMKRHFWPKAWIQGLLLIVLIGDLLIFNMRFDSVTAPFYHKKAFYGKSFAYQNIDENLRAKMDLVNYRLHAQHRAGLNANKSVIFDLPSYTGTLGYLSKRFSALINAFGYPEGTILIYPDDVADDARFLDLSAVRYVIEGEKTFSERPTALARLNLFFNYDVIGDDQAALDRLKSASFDPHATVVLQTKPGGDISADPFRRAEPIAIKSSSSDRITASVTAVKPGIILFNESYDPAWQAFVDGKETQVLTADYNFMACHVPAGTHQIIFHYRPRLFYVSLSITLAAFFLLLLGVAATLARKRLRAES